MNYAMKKRRYVIDETLNIFVVAFSLFLLSACVGAPKKANNCDQVVHETGVDLQGRLGVEIAKLSNKLETPKNPFPNTTSIAFILEGGDYRLALSPSARAADRFLRDGQQQLAYAKNIIAACKSFSSVSFGLNNSGWTNTFYLFPDGSVRPRVCVADPETDERWGMGFCD